MLIMALLIKFKNVYWIVYASIEYVLVLNDLEEFNFTICNILIFNYFFKKLSLIFLLKCYKEFICTSSTFNFYKECFK